MRPFGWLRAMAYNTGETVVWRAGDPLPDPEGKVRRIKRRRLS